MSKLKQPVAVETAFASYSLTEVLGEGGAGRVYGGVGPDGPIAIKVLSEKTATTEKKRRFKNEIAFLSRNKHPNIVTVTDYGVAKTGSIAGPFYVMKRFDGSLRDLLRDKLSPKNKLDAFSKILDGVEAAHMQGVTHRDLKPENILVARASSELAVADFGIASFTADLLITAVETGPTQRMANFQYAAPEQRISGRVVGQPADIYALAMILNEMFTQNIPHGTDYQLIGQVQKEFGFLDAVVAKALKQNPSERYGSVAELKTAIALHHSEFLSLQKISKIDATVIPASEVDEPLARVPPRVVGAEWDDNFLVLKLDRRVTPEWIDALRDIGSYTSVRGAEPHAFQFQGDTARVRVGPDSAQMVLDYFKEWLPRATQRLDYNLRNAARLKEQELREKLARERRAENERLLVTRSLKI